MAAGRWMAADKLPPYDDLVIRVVGQELVSCLRVSDGLTVNGGRVVNGGRQAAAP
jgi:hypothetical protein